MCEYNMSAVLAKEILKNRKGEDKKLRPQQYLCKVVNETFGLKDICIKVNTTL